MTEYELAMLFFEAATLAITSVFSPISIMAGFLAAGLLFGQHMDRRLTVLLVSLYTFFFLVVVSFATGRQLASYGNLAKEIQARTAEGADLAWHGANTVPGFMFGAMPITFSFLFLIAFAGSLAFFFHVQKTEPLGGRS